MGKIEELKEKMYSRAFFGRKRRERIPPEPRASNAPRVWTGGTRKRHSYILMAIGMLLGFGVIVGIGYAILQSGLFFYLLGKADVTVSVSAPDSAVAGDRVVYAVVYKNDGKNPIEHAELFFVYPKGVVPSDVGGVESTDTNGFRATDEIGEVPPGTEGHAEFAGRIFGKEGDALSAQATLQYQSGDTRSRFVAKASRDIRIERVPIALSFSGDAKVRSGDAYPLDLEYASNAAADFQNVSLRVVFPEGFQFQQSNIPATVSDAHEMVWSIGTLQPGTSGSVSVRGIMSGLPLEPKTFSYGIGVYNKDTGEWTPYIERTETTEIIEQPLYVSASVRGSRDTSVAFGDTVSATLTYKNNSSVPLSNVSLSTLLDGPVDFASLNTQTGSVVGSRTVQWSPATDKSFSVIQPGDERTVSFSFRVRRSDALGVVKNASIILSSHITADKSAGVDFNPEGSDVLMIPIKASIFAQTKTLYSGALIKNTGPIPPKVGVETSYTMVWEVSATGGDLQNVIMRATLPPYVTWRNVVVPQSEPMVYQKGTGEVLWNAGTVRVGGSDATRRVMFQISFVPSANQIQQRVNLATDISISGTDAFTHKDFTVTLMPATTDLPDDFGVPQGNVGAVQP